MVSPFIRRIRGLFGTAISWAAVWCLEPVLVWMATGFELFRNAPASLVLRTFAGTALIGGIAGLQYAALVSVNLRGRGIAALTRRRAAFLGGIAALPIPLFGLVRFVVRNPSIIPTMPLAPLLLPLGISFGLGSLTALGLRALAMRAPKDAQVRVTEPSALPAESHMALPAPDLLATRFEVREQARAKRP